MQDLTHVRANDLSKPMGLTCLAGLLIAFGGGCPQPVPPFGGTLEIAQVASGLTSPVSFAVPGDGTGRRFIAEQVGLIRILSGDDTLLDTPFLDLRSRIVPLSPAYDERGLLGLAFHPDYASNDRFFVFYSAPKGDDIPANFDSEVRVSEFLASAHPNVADPGSERIVLRVGKPQANHNGGQIAFGPDGMLYIGIGDGGAANDVGEGHSPGGNGQDLSNLLGKILRIDVDGGDPYAVPPDNPFVDRAGARGEIWAFGLRNPWRFSFDRGDPDRHFLGDVGQNLFEEVDLVVRGGNYGWPIREGFSCFNQAGANTPPANCPRIGASGEALIDPIIELAHNTPAGTPPATAVIGGYVYRGSDVPALRGRYIFGDYSTGFLAGDGTLYQAVEQSDGTWEAAEVRVSGAADGRLGRFLMALGEDERGELYVLTTRSLGPVGSTGEVFRIVRTP